MRSFVYIHIGAGTDITAYGFDSREDAEAFRTKYADDADENGAYKDIDDIPELPDGGRDDHTSDTWALVEGDQISYVDGQGIDYITPIRDMAG